MSKNARCQSLPQKFSPATSSRAPLPRWLPDRSNVHQWLIVKIYSSVPTWWQTWLNSSAVISRSSLWWIEGKPPWEQLRECSTEKCLPQVHWRSKLDGYQPCLRQTASRKALLCSTNPWWRIGNVDNQLEPFFSNERSIALFMLIRKFWFSSVAACNWQWLLTVKNSF